MAIDSLISQSIDNEKSRERELLLRKRVFYFDALLGNRIIEEAEWEKELQEFQLATDLKSYRVVLVEIDKYSEFQREYHQNDQNLFKFAMENVLKEKALSMNFSIWIDWLKGKQMGILFLGYADRLTNIEKLFEIIRSWVEQYLRLTVTIGIGKCVGNPNDIMISYDQAGEAIMKKILIGTNQLIIYEQTYKNIDYSAVHEFLPDIHDICKMYRMGDPLWIGEFNKIFDSLGNVNANVDDAIVIVNLLLNTFHREMMTLPKEYYGKWKNDTMPLLNNAFAQLGCLVDVRKVFINLLMAYENKIVGLRKSKQYASVAEGIKKYIEEHYANPDISLIHLGEVFDTNPKYVSFIFKAQIGFNFVDYLAHVRIKKAEELLLSTGDAITNIAEKVGYKHTVSFNRVFKKVIGLTPGRYRRNK